MTDHRQSTHDIAREAIVSFRDLSPEDRAAKLATLITAAQRGKTADTIRGKALIQFWQAAARAINIDIAHNEGTFSGTAEAHGNQREAAFVAAGDALLAYVVSVVPVSVADLLSGQPAPV